MLSVGSFSKPWASQLLRAAEPVGRRQMSIRTIAASAKSATVSGARSTVRTLVRLFSVRILGLIIEESVIRLHQVGNNFITVRMRRITDDVAPYAPIDAVGSPPFVHPAIVLQGPLLRTDRFSLETVRHYRRVAADSVVIVSTWNDESESALQELRDLGADVVVGERPTASGRMNVNLQVASPRRGLERARELGCSHVAKTRTDQRLYAVHQFAGLVEIAKGFPVSGHERPRERIVALSRLTSKYRPLFLSDMFMFGRTDDLLEYWSPESDARVLTSEEYQAKAVSVSDLHEYAECSPEHFLTESYLQSSAQAVSARGRLRCSRRRLSHGIVTAHNGD